MKAKLKIIRCTDHLLWYSNKVGQEVEYLGQEDDIFWSREDKGFKNIVKQSDAVILKGEL